MPKFNKNMIKGIMEQGKDEKVVRIGAGLLNNASLGEKKVKMKLEHIPRNLIEKNERNYASIGDISELAWSIQHIGLLTPLHVKKTENGYKLLGGERRLTAIDSLIDAGDSEWTETTPIPAIVQNFDEIDLPLDDDMKERFAMVTTNKETRKYTDADRLAEIREWKAIISALREAGVETLMTADDEGNEKEIKIKGEKTRDILAKTTSMSRGSINAFEKVENRGAESVKEALLNNDITVSMANKIIEIADTKEEQDEVLECVKEAGTAEKKIVVPEDEIRAEGTPITLAVFKKDLKNIMQKLKKETIYLDNEEIMGYYNCIKDLEKTLSR